MAFKSFDTSEQFKAMADRAGWTSDEVNALAARKAAVESQRTATMKKNQADGDAAAARGQALLEQSTYYWKSPEPFSQVISSPTYNPANPRNDPFTK